MRTLASLTSCSRSRDRYWSLKSWAVTHTPRTWPDASVSGAIRASQACAPRVSPLAFMYVCMS